MEERLKDAFDALTMPEACARQIESKLHNETRKEKLYCATPVNSTPGGWMKGVAAAAVLVLFLAAVGMIFRPGSVLAAKDPTETTESYADRREDILEQYRQEQERLKDELGREQERYREELGEINGEVPDARYATVLELIRNGHSYPVGSVMYTYTGAEGAIYSSVVYDTTLHTPWTVIEDGRVMFVLDKTIDITDQFSEEEPFTYIYTDIYYITHYIAIGGTPENPGFVEMTKFCWETDLHEGNLGSFGVNTWNSETESSYEWVERAREIFEPYGVYWVS